MGLNVVDLVVAVDLRVPPHLEVISDGADILNGSKESVLGDDGAVELRVQVEVNSGNVALIEPVETGRRVVHLLAAVPVITALTENVEGGGGRELAQGAVKVLGIGFEVGHPESPQSLDLLRATARVTATAMRSAVLALIGDLSGGSSEEEGGEEEDQEVSQHVSAISYGGLV